ncbi:MAG: hypothetical protein WBN66_02245 [Smithella sp.]
MGAWNNNDRAARHCDNPAKVQICINTKNKDEDGNELPGGVVFVSFLEGGVYKPIGKSPYGNGCQDLRMDLNTKWKIQVAPAPGYRCLIGRSGTFKMGKVDVQKTFVFECVNC